MFSRSLDRVEDGQTRIVRTDLRDAMLELKQAQGKRILVDDYRFVVGPVVVGEGRRLLEGVSLRKPRPG